MKKKNIALRYFAIIALLISSFFTGCLQVETTIMVNKDGSGNINEQVLFSKAFVNMLKDFAMAFQDSASTEEFSMFSEEEIKADAKSYGESVDYVSHELINTDNWEGYQAVYYFDDITKVRLSPDPDSKLSMDDEGANDEPEEYYFFSFIKGDTPELIIDRPDIEFEEEVTETSDTTKSEQSDDETGEEFMKLMEGMKINIMVEVEGDIESTNAMYVQDSRVTLFQMDFSEMMKNREGFEEFKKNEPKNIEEMKKYLEKLPGIKIEVEKPVTIKFN